MKKIIPNNFLWGASTSAYQVEGGWDKDNKGMSVQDLNNRKDLAANIINFKNAAKHYYHWKEDVALMKEMGFKSYRFSISWTRILPQGVGKPNQKGVKFYHELIDELIKNNIEPIVTIYHFDLPLALDSEGGWKNRDLIIPAFVNYAKILFSEYGSKVKYWQTINEQNILILAGSILGLISFKDENAMKSLMQQNHHMFIAQAKVMKMYHNMKLLGKIGPAPNIAIAYPASSKPEDIDAAYKVNAWRNWLYLDAACKGEYNKVIWNYFKKYNYTPQILDGDMEILKQGKPDFIAFNYYTSFTVKAATKKGPIKMNGDQQRIFDIPEMFDYVKNENLPTTEFGWEIDPMGFLHTCRALNDRYHLPLILTENGLGAYDKLENGKIHDQYRIEYLRKHIELIPQIISEGIDLFGYNPWSAIDLVSTHEGIKKRYGFIYVDINDDGHGDYKRYRKDSFYWYQKVINSNGSELN